MVHQPFVSMTWIHCVYLVALVYLSARQDGARKPNSLAAAWTWFALIPVSKFFFALLRAGNIRDPRDLALIEIWADGIGWLFLGISFYRLGKALNETKTPGPGPL